MDIEGNTVLWHVVDRLRRAKKLDQIIIVTTDRLPDDAIERFCRRENLACFRGSEEDVLDRYYRAAGAFQIDPIVRITSDCPLIDPEIVDHVIEQHQIGQGDYASNTLVRSFPRGLDTEVFTYQALQRAHAEASHPAEREHVTPYFYRHPEWFKLISVVAEPAWKRPDIRICVDASEDLELVRRIYRELKSGPKLLKDIVDLCNKKPDLLKINKGIEQKAV